MKIVVPCTVFKVESPIPPYRSTQLGSYNVVFDDHQHVVASQRGLILRSDIEQGPSLAVSNDTNPTSSTDTSFFILIDTPVVYQHAETE